MIFQKHFGPEWIIINKKNHVVTVNGVRIVLEEPQGIKFINVDNYWKIECEDNCYLDFFEWFDKFKANCENDIFNTNWVY